MAILDWRDRVHWGFKFLPCRWCGRPTKLLDDQKRPSHKVCAEERTVA